MHLPANPLDKIADANTQHKGHLIACPGCDLLHRMVELSPGGSASCRRCGHKLYMYKPLGVERALALTVAACIFFILSNSFPFMAIEVQGIVREISVLSAAIELFYQDMPGLGVFTIVVIFVFPLVNLVGMLMVLIPLCRACTTSCRTHTIMIRREALRLISILAPWNMMEIYLLGVLVSLVKLAAYAEITLGIAFWSFVALVIANTYAAYSMDRHYLWRRFEEAP